MMLNLCWDRLHLNWLSIEDRIVSDSGQLSGILAEATKRLKVLQRHETFLDGGVSFRQFWQEGDEILFLLEIVPALLDDALANTETAEKRGSLVRATIDELEFNQNNLLSPDYSAPAVLQTMHVDSLLAAGLQLPETLQSALRTHAQSIRAARGVHRITTSGAGDFTPELIKIENLLEVAKLSGEEALKGLRLFRRYRYQESVG